jgi:hypothetical protein
MGFLFSFLVLIIILGLIWWVVSVLPIPEPFKTIALVVLVVVCLLYLLSMLFGMAPAFPVFRGPYHY